MMQLVALSSHQAFARECPGFNVENRSANTQTLMVETAGCEPASAASDCDVTNPIAQIGAVLIVLNRTWARGGKVMYEIHAQEQYFFDEPTLDQLSEFLARWSAPCCICAPLLGKHAVEQGVPVTILDVDERFADVPGFRHYDLYNPEWIDQEFDLIFCDPPFFNVSLSQLFKALRLLSHHNLRQPLMLSYLSRRANAVMGTFAPFNLQSTGYRPGYQTVKKSSKNEIEVFSNLCAEQLEGLVQA